MNKEGGDRTTTDLSIYCKDKTKYINTLDSNLSQTPTVPPIPNLYHTQYIFIKHFVYIHKFQNNFIDIMSFVKMLQLFFYICGCLRNIMLLQIER